MKSAHLHQHYAKDDGPFVDQALEWIDRVQRQYTLHVTHFLNPHEALILQQLAAHSDLQVFSSSDFFPGEYRRVILAPEYYQLDLDDFEISLIEIQFASKFNRLRHSQILGTLLNQLGMERWVLGDILVAEDAAQFTLERPLVPLVLQSIQKISRVPVRLQEVSWDQRLRLEEEAKAKDILVSSMRLDKLIAASFNLSRSVASQLIQTNKVKLNYHEVNSVSQPLEIGHLVSVRGYGRFTLAGDNGLSKNGKHKLTVNIISSKKS